MKLKEVFKAIKFIIKNRNKDGFIIIVKEPFEVRLEKFGEMYDYHVRAYTRCFDND